MLYEASDMAVFDNVPIWAFTLLSSCDRCSDTDYVCLFLILRRHQFLLPNSCLNSLSTVFTAFLVSRSLLSLVSLSYISFCNTFVITVCSCKLPFLYIYFLLHGCLVSCKVGSSKSVLNPLMYVLFIFRYFCVLAAKKVSVI